MSRIFFVFVALVAIRGFIIKNSVITNRVFRKSILAVSDSIEGKAAAPRKRKPKNTKSVDVEPIVSIPEPDQNSNLIFYPQLSDSPTKTLSEDEMLYDMFLRQISELNGQPSPSHSEEQQMVEMGDDDQRLSTKLGMLLNSKRLVERPVPVSSGCPIEFVYKRRVVFGNYISRRSPTGTGITVRLTTGEVVAIDASQVVSCWELLADESPPQSSLEWAQVASDALVILGNMSPRKSDLQEFWHMISQRSNALPVDSLDLGIYIFQERRFRSWINPYSLAHESAVRALSAAQRYASALLLFHDDFHFRRRPSVLLSTDEAAALEAEQAEESDNDESLENAASSSSAGYSLEQLMSEDTNRRFSNSPAGREVQQNFHTSIPHNDEAIESDDSDRMYLIEGAYKCLEENTALFREGEVFHKYYQERSGAATGTSASGQGSIEKAAPFRAGCITRQLRALEMYSMSPAGMNPPLQVRTILRKLDKPASPAGAKMVLREMNLEARGQSSSGSGANSGSTSSRSGVVSSGTPWSPEVITAAEQLSEEIAAKRVVLSETYSGKTGKRGPSGRMDFRSSNQAHPVICIDGSKAVFLDDAFSLSPETGEILVHVVDVAGSLRRYEALQETARERISSTFLPSGPIHMLPPQALEALKLSTSGPNEVITVGLSVDAEDGTLIGIRVFPSVIGPVFPVDIDTADEILESVSHGDKDGWSFRLGYPEAVVKDLVTAQRLMERVIEKQPWVDKHFSAGQQRTFSLNKRTGTYKQAFVDKTPGNRMLNAMLTMYSNSTCRFCNERGVSVPLAWENRDSIDSQLIRRFATQPLRNWLAQLQQKQLRAALKMELPLTRKDCAMAVAHHNSRRKQMSTLQNAGRDIMSFESLESHCATVMASGQGEVILNAEGLGRGGSVKLTDFKVIGTVTTNVPRGEKVRVRVRKVTTETRTVLLDLVEE